MKIRKIVPYFLLHILFSCADVTEKEQNNISTLSNILKHLLKSCNTKISKVVVNSDADENLIKSIYDAQIVGLILLKNLSKFEIKKQYKHKVDSFVVEINDWDNKLEQTLHVFEQSPWWNIMTPFFLLSKSEDGCNDAEKVLQTVWKMNILICYFVCFESSQNPYVFTFNPYSNYASDQWKIVREITNGSTYMAIYKRPYLEENICKNFYFDRTKHLDKATINIGLCISSFKPDLLSKITDKNQSLIYTHFEPRIIDALKQSLKVSLKFNYGIEIIDGTTKPYGAYNFLKSKRSDFLLCFCTFEYLFGYPGSHQVIYSHYSIFSNSRGFRSPLEKIYNFYGPLMIIATIIISAITYFVIFYVNKQGHWFAVFEIIRLWTSTSLYTKIDTLALRIFFGVIFIYFLILQATFTGHLSKFLTNPELRDNAETLKDLESSLYQKIHLSRSSIFLVENNELLKSKSELSTLPNCIRDILRKEPSACISIHVGFSILFSRLNVTKQDLKDHYLSKNSLRNHYFIYPMRHDWPLKNKFNNFLVLLEDTGILQKLNNNFTSNLNSLLFDNKIDPEFQPINLESLFFIFYVLIIGLVSATLCFAAEKYWAYKIKKSKVFNKVIGKNYRGYYKKRNFRKKVIVV